MASLRGPRRRVARSSSEPVLRPQVPLAATFSSAAKAKPVVAVAAAAAAAAAGTPSTSSSTPQRAGPRRCCSSSAHCCGGVPVVQATTSSSKVPLEGVLAEAKGQRLSQLPRPCRERLEGVLVKTLKANFGDSIPLRRPGESRAKTLIERIGEEVAEFSSSAALTAANLRRLQRRVAQHAAMRLHEPLSPPPDEKVAAGTSFSRETDLSGPNAYSDGSSTLLLQKGRPKSADVGQRHHESRRPRSASALHERARVRCGLPNSDSRLTVAACGDDEEAVQDFLRKYCQEEAIAEKVARSVDERLKERARQRHRQRKDQDGGCWTEGEERTDRARRRGGGGGQRHKDKERASQNEGLLGSCSSSKPDLIYGEQWAGPRAPAKVLTPSRTSVLPEGKMKLNGATTTSGDLGRGQRPEDLATRAENKSLSSIGTNVLPGGPMAFYGTTMGDLGNMYVWLGDKNAHKKTWSSDVDLKK